MVKIANAESVFRGILEFWPLDIYWDGSTASIRKIAPGPMPMQTHVAFRVDRSKDEILEALDGTRCQGPFRAARDGTHHRGLR